MASLDPTVAVPQASSAWNSCASIFTHLPRIGNVYCYNMVGLCHDLLGRNNLADHDTLWVVVPIAEVQVHLRMVHFPDHGMLRRLCPAVRSSSVS